MSALVAVEVLLRSGLLLFSVHCLEDDVQHQIHALLCSRLVGHDAVVIQIPDHGQVQFALSGMDIGDIGHPFAVRHFGMKISVEEIFIFM